MPVDHRERAFETSIEHTLLTKGGYALGDPSTFDRERAIFPADFIAFLKTTQPDLWQSLEKLHGTSTETILIDD